MNDKNDTKYPEGHFIGKWIGIGMALSVAVGIPLSIVLDLKGMIGVWAGMGVAVGVAIGTSIEAKYKREGKIRPATEDEKKKRSKLVTAGVGMLMIGLIVFLVIIFLIK